MNRGRTPLFRSVVRMLRETSPSVPSRREFIRLAGAAGMTSAIGLQGKEPVPVPADGTVPTPPTPAPAPTKKIEGPVAIVGGGIAGLTAAYRLMKAGVEVHLYEASQRFGGRMYTKRDFNADGMFVELGGELVDSNHTDLIELAKELGLELQSLKEGDAGLDFYSFGGKIYTDHDVIKAFEPLSKRIAEDAEGLYDDKEEFTDKARQLDGSSLKEYLKSIAGGVEPWVIQMLEVAYVPEYGVDTERQSALNFVDFINPDTSNGFQIFGDSDEAMRVSGGNETLPAAVYRSVQRSIKSYADHRLVKIAEDGSKIKLTFVAGSKVISPSYENVIMAIPFTILRTIDGVDALKLSDDKKRSIKEMGYGTNIKVMYGFNDRQWRTPFGGRDFFCNGSVYADKSFQTVWETSRGQNGNRGIITNFMGGSAGSQYSADQIEKFIAELDTIFPGLKAKHDGTRTMMNWPNMKTIKGSYSCPLVGQYTWVYEAAATPELDGHLLFAGEHTSSEFPGYMNGGLETGNRVVRELLGIEAEA